MITSIAWFAIAALVALVVAIAIVDLVARMAIVPDQLDDLQDRTEHVLRTLARLESRIESLQEGVEQSRRAQIRHSRMERQNHNDPVSRY